MPINTIKKVDGIIGGQNDNVIRIELNRNNQPQNSINVEDN